MIESKTNYKEFETRLGRNSEYATKTIPELSEKYIQISTKSDELIGKLGFEQKYIRNWSAQDDMGVPVQFRRFLHIDFFFFENLLRFLRQILPTQWRKTYHQRNALIDDFRIIKEGGALDILKENPVTATPFGRDIFFYKSFKFNSRYLRYVYIVSQIRKYKLLDENIEQTYVDIGNFYGGLQGLLKKYYKKTTFISVELPHQLFRSYLYHKKLFPETIKIVGISEYQKYMKIQKKEPAFVYLLPQDFNEIGNLTDVDLLTNFLSFGEMSAKNFSDYFNSITIARAKKLYFVNRFISSPSIDKTYDSKTNLINYLLPNTAIELLDVFPIHHYMLTKRKFLGRSGFRNTSSPQFELIQTGR